MDFTISEDHIERPPFVNADMSLKKAERVFKAHQAAQVLVIIDQDTPIAVLQRATLFEYIANIDASDKHKHMVSDISATPAIFHRDTNLRTIADFLTSDSAQAGAFLYKKERYAGWVAFDALVKTALHGSRSTLLPVTVEPNVLDQASKNTQHKLEMWTRFLKSVKADLAEIGVLTSKLMATPDVKLSSDLGVDIQAILQDLDHQLIGASLLYRPENGQAQTFSMSSLLEFLKASWTVGDSAARSRPAIRLKQETGSVTLPNAQLIRYTLQQMIRYLAEIFPSQIQIINLSFTEHSMQADIKIRAKTKEIEQLSLNLADIYSPSMDKSDLFAKRSLTLINLVESIHTVGAQMILPEKSAKTWSVTFPAEIHLENTNSTSQANKRVNLSRALIATDRPHYLTELCPVITELGWHIDTCSSLVDLGVNARRNPYQLIICDLDAFGQHEAGLKRIIRAQNPLNRHTPIIGLTNGINPIADKSIVPFAILTPPFHKTELVSALLDALMEQGRNHILPSPQL